ncbi:MAG TPA: hypothetical protein VI547_03090 [Anaerolineales bacterium]|nr:hypothetical protein [Anaerolineales bacterium]HLF00934.1 hypothetical protein [Anaerolineales bacterium]
MFTSPILHGSAGAWDEILFGIAFVISVIIFIALAFADRKHDAKEKSNHEQDS